MFSIDNIKAGQIATFFLGGEVPLNKTIPTEDGRVPHGLGVVTRKGRQVGTVCGRDTYFNRYPERKEDSKGNWFQWTDKPGVVVHPKTGVEYIAILPISNSTTYFVDGVEATAEQVAVIRAAKKSKSDGADFIVMKRENLENLA